jgi:hypothetical protein
VPRTVSCILHGFSYGCTDPQSDRHTFGRSLARSQCRAVCRTVCCTVCSTVCWADPEPNRFPKRSAISSSIGYAIGGAIRRAVGLADPCTNLDTHRCTDAQLQWSARRSAVRADQLRV